MKTAKIKSANGSLEFHTPYDALMLADFKSRIPSSDRRWDPHSRLWLVSPTHLATLEQLCDCHGLVTAKELSTVHVPPRTLQRIVRVEYIGAPKEREDGSLTSFGYADGSWSIIFPQDVLRGWFELSPGVTEPTAATTYYGLLGITRAATPAELKAAYRRLAKRWHPDVNQDPDAGEMFQRITLAHEVLSDPAKRDRYDAGLALEASLTNDQRQPHRLSLAHFWRPPLRCGWLLVEATERLSRLNVNRILAWEDITDADGRVLVTSWPTGANHFTENWL